MRIRWLAMGAVLALTAAFVGGGAETEPQASATERTRCGSVSIPVPLIDDGPVAAQIGGRLCRPPGSRTLQILVAGGTYGKDYWSTRGARDHGSYVETTNRAGYATLAIDRIGVGVSSMPRAAELATDTQEVSIRELVRGVRAGRLGEFDRVIMVGNSFGSTLARALAIHYPGLVDGIVLTGEASKQNDVPWNELLRPAAEDPKFRARNPDSVYYTTRPGERDDWFLYGPGTEPGMPVVDELAKETDVYSDYYRPPVENTAIRVPVLIVVGAQDRLLCGPAASDCRNSASLRAQESPYYPNAELEVVVLPATGHAVNLHRSAPQWINEAVAWANRNVGTGLGCG